MQLWSTTVRPAPNSPAGSVTTVSTTEDAGAAPVTPTDRTTALALAAAGVTVVLWASAFVAIRHVGREVSPGPLTLGRLLVGSLVLGSVVMVRGPRWPARRDWRLLLVCGLLWFGVYNIALNAAEQRVDAGTSAMLVNVGPLILALLAGVLLGEGFPSRLVVGSLVAFGGVAVIAAAPSGRSAGTAGVLLCLVAAVGYAVGVVAQKPLLGRLPALEVTWLACTTGAVACLPFAPQLVSEAADARVSTLAWIGYLGAFPTAVAFTTWAFALSHTTAGRMGATTYLVPPVAVLLAWLLLDESPEPLAFVGGALCLLGVAIARRTRRPRVRPEAPA
jgi:drug/metabolite transporter (DMT)-like permease